jgi:bacterioferritin-associated ferredoxin
MLPDDELCLCFHVTWRKVIRFIQINRIRVPSQVSECQGAGTGCGWCRKSISRLVAELGDGAVQPQHLEQWLEQEFPSNNSYRIGRSQHFQDGHGSAPQDPTQPPKS